jgi:hypothetical protein
VQVARALFGWLAVPFRLPKSITLDFVLGKFLEMPWNERHQLQFR